MASKNVIPLDTSMNAVNPASDENVALLRRIVKLLEASGTQDSAQRQRVAVDTFGANLALGAGTNVVGLVCLGASTGGGNVPIMMVDQRFEFMDRARIAYVNGIRSNLTF